MRAVNWLPAKCVGYMGIVWADERNNAHTVPITRQVYIGCLSPVRQFCKRFKRISVQSEYVKKYITDVCGCISIYIYIYILIYLESHIYRIVDAPCL